MSGSPIGTTEGKEGRMEHSITVQLALATLEVQYFLETVFCKNRLPHTKVIFKPIVF